MPFPIKICAVCGEEFELKPDKPGFANRCLSCTEEEAENNASGNPLDAGDREMNDARKKAIRDLLYRKES